MANALRVPIITTAWFSYDEMVSTFELLYDENSENQYEGLARVAVWRARMGEDLPLGVDVTATMIRATLHDKECQEAFELGQENRHTDVVLIYSMAFIRFINLITELGQWKTLAEAVNTVALRMGLPTWLVELRHEAAHRTMPTSLSVLRAGAKLALNWIREHFWEKVQPDRIVTTKERKFRETFIKIQQILYELQSKKTDEKKMRTSLAVLRHSIFYMLARIGQNPKRYIGVILEEGYLIFTPEQLKLLIGEGDTFDDKYVQTKIMDFWVPFLQNLHQFNCKMPITIADHFMSALEEGMQSEHYLRLTKLWLKGILQFSKEIGIKIAPETAAHLMSRALLSKCEAIKETLKLLYAMCKPHLLEAELQKIDFVVGLDEEDESGNFAVSNIDLTKESSCLSDEDLATTVERSDLECTPWQLCSDEEMKLIGEVPCGLLPNQIFNGIPDFKLPDFVNKFNSSLLDDGHSISVFEKARTNPDEAWSSEEIEKMQKRLAWI